MKKEGLCKLIHQVKDTLIVHKRKLCALVACMFLLAIASVGAKYMFEIKGVVTGVDDRKIAVTDFLMTRTADLSDSPLPMPNLQPGDAIKIRKNLQGMVLSVKVDRHADKNRNPKQKDLRFHSQP